MREERERREKVVGKRERIWCFKRKLEINMEGGWVCKYREVILGNGRGYFWKGEKSGFI